MEFRLGKDLPVTQCHDWRLGRDSAPQPPVI